MDAEIEMDDVPLSVAEPDFEFLQAVGGGAAVFGGTVDVGLAGEGGANREGVAAGDGIADEEDAGKLRIVGDEVPGGGGAFDEVAFVNWQVEGVAEIFLEGFLPCLALSGKCGDLFAVEAVDALVFGGLFRGGFGGVGGLRGREPSSRRAFGSVDKNNWTPSISTCISSHPDDRNSSTKAAMSSVLPFIVVPLDIR